MQRCGVLPDIAHGGDAFPVLLLAAALLSHKRHVPLALPPFAGPVLCGVFLRVRLLYREATITTYNRGTARSVRSGVSNYPTACAATEHV